MCRALLNTCEVEMKIVISILHIYLVIRIYKNNTRDDEKYLQKDEIRWKSLIRQNNYPFYR